MDLKAFDLYIDCASSFTDFKFPILNWIFFHLFKADHFTLFFHEQISFPENVC